MLSKIKILSLFLFVFKLVHAENYTEPTFSKSGLKFVVLDKLTNKKQTYTTLINKPISVGTLEITPKACFKSAPDEQPETSAYVVIVDRKVESENQNTLSVPELLYQDWMFASAPSLNPFDHSQYNITILECTENK